MYAPNPSDTVHHRPTLPQHTIYTAKTITSKMKEDSEVIIGTVEVLGYFLLSVLDSHPIPPAMHKSDPDPQH